MEFVFLVVLLFAGVTFVGYGSVYIPAWIIDKNAERREMVAAANKHAQQKKPRLSSAAKAIKQEFDALPTENRPAFDVEEVVLALDAKYGRAELDEHFWRLRTRGHEGDPWDCIENTLAGIFKRFAKPCPFIEYHELHDSLEAVKTALAKQEKMLELSKHTHGLDAVKELTEALRSEAIIVNSVTKELS